MKGKWVGLMFSLAITCCFGQSDDCNLKRNTDGIKVFVCDSGKEKFKTLRAEFILENTTIAKYLEFLFDVDNYTKWQYNMASAEMLSKISEDEMMYHVEINAPWPIEDREMYANFKIDRDAGPDQVTIVIQNFVPDRPVRSGFIRIPFFTAEYHLAVINETSLAVEYKMSIDPGGSVPPWLVNIALAEGPYISFKNLKERISDEDTPKN